MNLSTTLEKSRVVFFYTSKRNNEQMKSHLPQFDGKWFSGSKMALIFFAIALFFLKLLLQILVSQLQSGDGIQLLIGFPSYREWRVVGDFLLFPDVKHFLGREVGFITFTALV